ncbi:MAG: zinc-ribbon domain-containing protein, partial [Ruminiclostridium sp.]|nr:zinc-ribbon domain-containing protein [Ruminiclostridium sp.]
MFCHNCGNPMTDNAAFCSNCGAKSASQPQPKREPRSDIPLTQLYRGPEPKLDEEPTPVQQPYTPPVYEYNVGKKESEPKQPKSNIMPTAVQVAIASEQQEVPKKSGGGLKVVLIILVVLLIAVLGIIAVIMLSGNNSASPFGSQLQFVHKDDETYFVLNGEVLEDTVDGYVSTVRAIWRGTKSLKGDVYFFGGYAIKDKKLYEFADDLYVDDIGLFDIKYSNYGEGVAYLNEDMELMLYRFETDKSEKVEGKKNVHSFAISPDAKTVLYTTNDDGYEVYLYKDGESEKLDDDLGRFTTAVAVSNDGEYCYVYDWSYNKVLYCYNSDGDREVLFECEDGTGITAQPLAFNIDNTQISYAVQNESKVVVYDGVDDKKTEYDLDVSSSVDQVPCSDYYIRSIEYSKEYALCSRFPKMIFTAVENLNNCYYIDGRLSTKICYIDDDEIKEFSENNGMTVISSDNDEIFYFDSKENTLYYSNLEDKKPKKIVDDIMGFGVTPDFKHIFYITIDEELYVADADGNNEEKLDDDVCGKNYRSDLSVHGELIPRIIGDNHILYASNDGDIYLCDINGEKTKIKAEIDFKDYNFVDDYSNMYGKIMGGYVNYFVYPNRAFITYVDDGDLYIIDRKGEISLLLEA